MAARALSIHLRDLAVILQEILRHADSLGDQAVEEALCFGQIDSTSKPLNPDRFVLLSAHPTAYADTPEHSTAAIVVHHPQAK